MSRGTVSPLFSPLSSDFSWTLLITVASNDGEGVKIDWAIWVPKAGSLVLCVESTLVTDSVLCLESRLIVRPDDGMGSMCSPSISSPFEEENVAS